MAFADIPTAKANLVELLKARQLIIDRDVFVSYGIPRTLPDEREHIYVLRAETTRTPSLVPTIRTDTSAIAVLVEARVPELDAAIAEQHVYDLLGEIEAALMGEFPLGRPWSRPFLSSVSEFDPEAVDDGWNAQATATVALGAEVV